MRPRIPIPFLVIALGLLSTHMALGQTSQDALGLYKEGQELYREASSKADLEKAIQKYEEALLIRRRQGDRAGEGQCLNAIGLIFNSLGQYAKALEYYKNALEIDKKLGDLKGAGVVSSNIGLVYDSLGQYAKAMEYYETSLEMAKKTGDLKQEGVTLNNIGAVKRSQGEYAKALHYYEKSLEIRRKLGDVKGEAVTLSNMGLVYDSRGQYAKALEYYEKSLQIKKKIGDVRGEAVTLNNIGAVKRSQGEYAKALEYYETSLEIKRKLGDAKGEAVSLSNMGLVYDSQGQYPRALDYYEKSLEIKRRIGDIQGEAVTLNNIAGVYRSWGQYSKALEYYEKDLAITRKLGDVRNEGVTLNNIGLVYDSWGEYAKALEYYEKSLQIRKKVGDVQGEGVTLSNMGLVYDSWGQYAKALEYYDKSLKIAKEIGDVKQEGTTLNNIGAVHRSRGQYANALEYYEKSLEIKRRIGDIRGEGVTLSNMGLVYDTWGQYARALEYYEKSLEIKRKIGDVQGEGVTLNNIGAVNRSQGQYTKALEYYQRSLEIRQRLGDVRGEGVTLSNMAQIQVSTGKFDEALSNFHKTLDIYTRIGVSRDGVRDSIGETYLEMGDISRAEPYLREADYHSSVGRLSLLKSDFSAAKDRYEKLLKRAEENRNANSLFTAYTGLGRVYESLEDYARAAEYYEKGVQLVEDLRSSLLPSERKDFFNVKINGFYRSDPGKGLTRVRMKLNQASGSIDSSEVTRARAFADNLFERSAAGGSGLPQQLRDREDSLLNQVGALKKERARTDREKQAGRYESLSKEIKEAESDLKSFIEKLRKDHPGYAAVKYPRPVTLHESALQQDEYVVVFDVSNEGVGVKLIHNKKIKQTFYNDWPQQELERDVKLFREPFETGELTGFDCELGHSLYRKLMLRVMLDVPKGHPVVIIPDGILAVLPFEALVTAGTATWTPGKLSEYPAGVTFLGDEHPLNYYQSITALSLARTMGNKVKPGEKLLVLANPVFDMRDERAQAARQSTVAVKDGKQLLNVMKAIEDETGLRFGALPETGHMANKLGEMFTPHSAVFTGLEANKSEFLSNIAPRLDEYGRIVFATHGVFSTRIPGLKEPFLALTMVPPGTDGFLRMSDILSLKMNADIVALTACQTGLGRELSGEGVMSMGRAFQYAGARSVLMSLWEVQVDSALLLVETFFNRLKAGRSKLDALVEARKAVRRAGYEHPFFWAPFILVGEAN